MSMIAGLLGYFDIASFAVSMSASITWDGIKKYFANKKDNSSSEYLLYKVFCDTFHDFYEEKGYEFIETIIMDAFIEQVSSIDENKITNFDKKFIEGVIDPIKLSDGDIDLFTKCLTDTLAKPEYSKIYKKLILNKIISIDSQADNDWMEIYMDDNWCKISFHEDESAFEIFKGVKCTLDEFTWSYLQKYIVEVFFNAQEHGKAKDCKFKIETKAIILTDDGSEFNPMKLRKIESLHGGTMTLDVLLEYYPNLKMKYNRKDGMNVLKIYFDNPCFDVNSLCEIQVPSLRYMCPLETAFEGTYRYCFIDVCKTVKQDTMFALSSLFKFADLIESFRRFKNFEKLFLYFSNTDEFRYRALYNDWKRILSCNSYSDFILLVPEEIDLKR